MFVHSLDPVALAIGPITIYWYGIVYVLGFIGLYWGLRKVTDLSEQEVDSLLVYLVVGLLLGARLFFFTFYRPDLFSPIEFISIWNGGMSFHGALVGLAGSVFIWSKRYKKNPWEIVDVGALLAGWFLALGRIANFVNAEIVGPVFNGSWCVQFPGEDVCRHPVQLYAALKDVFLGSLLYVVYKSNKAFTPGFLFWCFVFIYGVLRFIVQFWRIDPVVLFSLQMGHLLSVIFVGVAVYMLAVKHKQDLVKLFKR